MIMGLFNSFLNAWYLFWTILVHKYYIFIWGLRLGVPIWQLIMHDCSKFCSEEWCGYLKKNDKTSTKYLNAWLHHQNHNKHHSQYWVLIEKGEMVAIEMPEKYVREMICDWIAANKVYDSSEVLLDYNYFEKNRSHILSDLHPKTIDCIKKIIEKDLSFYHVDKRIIELFDSEIHEQSE